MLYDNDVMIDEMQSEKIRLLPAWFCQRMIAQDGRYALVLNGGVTVAISRITTIHQDNSSHIWLDVKLMPMNDAEVCLGNGGAQARPIIAATGEARNATLNSASIMLAYELNPAQDLGDN